MDIRQDDSGIPILDDVSFEDLLHDPYPAYARARALGPVVRVPAARLLLVPRFDDIIAIERDPETFSSVNPDSQVVRLFGPNLMRKDGADHQRERKAIEPSLRPGTASRCWAPRMEAITDEVISGFAADGRADLFGALAAPVAGRALAAITGFTDVGWQQIAAWSQGMMDGAGNYAGDPEITARARAVGHEIEAAVDRALPRLAAAPDESLLSAMQQAGLTRTEIHGNIKVAIGGGFNEPRDAILSLLLGLLSNPDQRDLVLADPALWPQAFEEAIRWISPIGMYPRRLTRDAELGGLRLAAGTQIGLSVASANRDERRFQAADRFDLLRPKAPHLAFGSGPHYCAGTWVARILVTRIVGPRLFARLRNLRLPDPARVTLRGWVFRGPTTLPVTWDA